MIENIAPIIAIVFAIISIIASCMSAHYAIKSFNYLNGNFSDSFNFNDRILKLEKAHIATLKPSVKRKRKSGKHGKS